MCTKDACEHSMVFPWYKFLLPDEKSIDWYGDLGWENPNHTMINPLWIISHFTTCCWHRNWLNCCESLCTVLQDAEIVEGADPPLSPW